MDLLEALNKLPQIVEDYERISHELIEAKREIEALKNDGYVTWNWVCSYFDIDLKTAKLMLKDETFFVHNRQIKRFQKSVILSFAQRNSLKVKDVYTMNYR